MATGLNTDDPMKTYIYYPGMEVRDELWLKFALIYLERLAFVYEEGDEIYIFGFSRGAFAARRLAGFISVAGIVSRRHAERAREEDRQPIARVEPETGRLFRAVVQPLIEEAVQHGAQAGILRSRLRKGAGGGCGQRRGAAGGEELASVHEMLPVLALARTVARPPGPP